MNKIKHITKRLRALLFRLSVGLWLKKKFCNLFLRLSQLACFLIDMSDEPREIYVPLSVDPYGLIR